MNGLHMSCSFCETREIRYNVSGNSYILTVGVPFDETWREKNATFSHTFDMNSKHVFTKNIHYTERLMEKLVRNKEVGVAALIFMDVSARELTTTSVGDLYVPGYGLLRDVLLSDDNNPVKSSVLNEDSEECCHLCCKFVMKDSELPFRPIQRTIEAAAELYDVVKAGIHNALQRGKTLEEIVSYPLACFPYMKQVSEEDFLTHTRAVLRHDKDILESLSVLQEDLYDDYDEDDYE